MKAEREYKELLESGMFFEFYPELSGDWERDKDKWFEIYDELTILRSK